MDIRQKNTLLVTAILAGLMSLPLTWMTIHNARVQSEGGVNIRLGFISAHDHNAELKFGGGMNDRGGMNAHIEMFGAPYSAMSFDVTGLNGHVTMFFNAPLWFVICVAIGANVLQLMQHSRLFTVPTFAAWGTALIGIVWTSAPIGLTLVTGKATPGIGWLPAMYCAAAPIVCLSVLTRSVNDAAHADAAPNGGPIAG